VNTVFYIAAAIALATTGLAITRQNPVYGLLNFVVSLLAMAVVFFALGAPFAAALEVIVYAGAIMVLFLFVVMMLSLSRTSKPGASTWTAPVLLALLLGGALAFVLLRHGQNVAGVAVSPQAVGQALFGRDVASVELASMLLLAGLVAAYHLGREKRR
jgi:NADH-quinone oxidoreductase subunit J